MKRRTAVLLAVVCVLTMLQAGVYAIDRQDVEEIFKFCPDLNYFYIHHVDKAALLAAPAYGQFERSELEFGKGMFRWLEPDDPALKVLATKCDTYTSITYNRSQEWDNERLDTLMTNDREFEKAVGRSRLWYAVYRLPDPATVRDKLIKDGLLTASDKKIGGIALMSSQSKVGKQQETTFFLFTKTGEVLVSRDVEPLREALLAGTGQSSSIFENSSYIELLYIQPELGQIWSAHFPRSWAYKDEMIRRLEETGRKDEADMYRRTRRYQPLYSITSYIIDSSIRYRYIQKFIDAEMAEQTYREMPLIAQGSVKRGGEFGLSGEWDLFLYGKSTWELDGPVLIQEYAMDDDYYKHMLQYREAEKAFKESLKAREEKEGK